jgi:hypothetical protein
MVLWFLDIVLGMGNRRFFADLTHWSNMRVWVERDYIAVFAFLGTIRCHCTGQEAERASDVIMVETNTCMYARDVTKMQVYVAYIADVRQAINMGNIIVIRLCSMKVQVHAKLDRHVFLETHQSWDF